MRLLHILALAGASLTLPSVSAQTYPDRPVTLIVAFAPGGTSSIVGRSVAQYMSDEIHQPIVVDHRPGAGGAIGTVAVARSAPDGYTMGLATVSTHVINPACNPNLSYDPVKDFRPIVMLARSAKMIAVHPSFPATNFEEFKEEIKKNPGKYSYATSGVCALGHLLGEQYQALTGSKLVHVPYRGAGPALNDVLGGQVPILMDNLPAILPSIKAGKLRPIILSWDERMADLPDVPTFAEVGLQAMNQAAWHGLVAPAGTPDDVIRTLNQAAVKVLKNPKLAETIRGAGAEPAGNTSEQFGDEIRTDFENMKQLVKTQNIQIE